MSTRKAPPRATKKRGRKKGTPKTGGRQKGTPNKVTVEAKAAAEALVDDPVYRAKLAEDFQARRVHPTIESMIWHYAKGKPKESVELSGGIKVTDDEATREQVRQLDTPVLRKLRELARQREAVLAAAGVVTGGSV